MSGTEHFTSYGDSGCTMPTPSGDFTCNLSGSCNYDMSSCAFSDGTGLNCGGGTITFCNELASIVDCFRTATKTATTFQLSATGACCPGESAYGFMSNNYLAKLTDMDTTGNAINRLLAGPGGVWSAYGSSPTCGAGWQNEQSTGAFNYTEARWQLKGVGSPGKSYSTSVIYWRRSYGIGDFIKYMTDVLSVTADGSGNWEASGNVPNDMGYETYAVAGTCKA
jgi:hypothetical protein